MKKVYQIVFIEFPSLEESIVYESYDHEEAMKEWIRLQNSGSFGIYTLCVN